MTRRRHAVRKANDSLGDTTTRGCGVFFPALAIPTGKLVLPKLVPPPGDNRGLMMPTRRRTRAHDRAARIDAERRINETRIAAEAAQHAARIASDSDPPPF